MSDKEKFRIWYSDGEMRFGWLHWDGQNGRTGDVATYSKESAEAQLELERRGDLALVMIPVDANAWEEERLIAECRATARAKQRARWSGK